MVYPALLPLMRTPRLPVVDWTDAPADLNGLVRFAERRNLVSARVPTHFNWRRGKGRGCHHVITATNFVFCRSQWPRCLRVRLLWSQKRHNTTVRTDSRQGGRNQKHYCFCQLLQWNRYDWNVISPDCLAPTNRVCFEPTVWSDTCSSTRRIRDWEQEALVQL
jgi:hypothetical protein